jgi:hypothetical protein
MMSSERDGFEPEKRLRGSHELDRGLNKRGDPGDVTGIPE